MDLPTDITSILQRVTDGDERAVDELLPLVYEELRKQANVQMAHERFDHTLQATALVHDAYVRLLGQGTPVNWASRGHFFATAANAMRRILVDHARSKARVKRGGDRHRVEINDRTDDRQAGKISPEQLLELDDALEKLASTDVEVFELVRLRLYAGVSVTEAAKLLGLSRTVAYERWEYALCWFNVELAEAAVG